MIRERLIDEELLIQRAIELDLIRNDSLIKGNIIQTMFQHIINSNEVIDPSEKQLRDYFRKEKDYFSSGKRFKLKNYSFRNLNEAETGSKYLKKNNFDAFLNLTNKENIFDVPEVFLTPQKIRDYLGPKALQELEKLNKGDYSKVIQLNDIPSIIFCIDILYSKTPLFEEIYDQIKDKFIREREDILVKEYIENLRNFYEIEKYSF